LKGKSEMASFKTLIEWLNQNSGAMQVVFAAFVALATVSYAVLTAMMWLEMRRTNRRLEQPNVQAIFETLPLHEHLTKLTVKNIGNVSVHDLTVTIDPPDFPSLEGKFLNEIPLFRRSIPVLCRNAEISTVLFNFLDINKTKFKDSILTFKLSYKTPTGQQQPPQTYSYDIAVYKVIYLTEESIRDIVKPLEDIAKKLK
jgi:hypothetical protein